MKGNNSPESATSLARKARQSPRRAGGESSATLSPPLPAAAAGTTSRRVTRGALALIEPLVGALCGERPNSVAGERRAHVSGARASAAPVAAMRSFDSMSRLPQYTVSSGAVPHGQSQEGRWRPSRPAGGCSRLVLLVPAGSHVWPSPGPLHGCEASACQHGYLLQGRLVPGLSSSGAHPAPSCRRKNQEARRLCSGYGSKAGLLIQGCSPVVARLHRWRSLITT